MTGKKEITVSVRFDKKTTRALEIEAAAVGLDRGAYVRFLVFKARKILSRRKDG